MPKIDVNKKRGYDAQIELETFWNDNKNLENLFNKLLPVTWGTDIGHVTSRIPNKGTDLFIPIGKNENGYFTFDLTIGRDILVGGTMLSGVGMFRRVSLVSLIKTHTSETLRIIFIDNKKLMVDFDNIPHLQFSPARTLDDSLNTLKWCHEETERRIDILVKSKTHNISDYNKYKLSDQPLIPSIVVFITELGDLIDIPSFDNDLYRIACMTRATNIHLVVTTQQPSVSVITARIQESFGYRIAFQMPYETESKLFIGQAGAEELLGQGDMLFKNGDEGGIIHLQALHYEQ
jgi:S-DNA-T family DNA segregation ATPase FtsK/SpoIIIE